MSRPLPALLSQRVRFFGLGRRMPPSTIPLTIRRRARPRAATALPPHSPALAAGARVGAPRRGDPWAWASAYPPPRPSLSPRRSGWKRQLLETVEAEVRQREAAGVSRYHEGVRRLLRRHFNPQSFYLTAEGLVVFYPMYAIAPAMEGIPTFLVPWEAIRGEYGE